MIYPLAMSSLVVLTSFAVIISTPGGAGKSATLVSVDAEPSIRQATQALAAALAVQQVEVTTIAAGDELPCQVARRRAIHADYDAAMADFAKVNLNGVHANGEAGLARFEEAADLVGETDWYVALHMLLGWEALERRNRGVARNHFRAARAVSPEFQPAPETYPPPVQDAFKELTADTAMPRRTLTIGTTPAGATAIVDDKSSCTTPCSVHGLLPGQHFVTVALDGYAPMSRVVKIERNAKEVFTLSQAPRLAEPPLVIVSRRPDARARVELCLNGSERQRIADFNPDAEAVEEAAIIAAKIVARLPDTTQAAADRRTTVRHELSKDLAAVAFGPDAWILWTGIGGAIVAVAGASVAVYLANRPNAVRVVVVPP